MDESEEAVVVVGTLEEAEAVVETSEEAEAVVETPEGRGPWWRRGAGVRQFAFDTSLPPKRIKKCRALHGLDQKEL